MTQRDSRKSASGRLARLLADVRSCRMCEQHLPLGPRPVLRARESARLLIIGQAPGTKVHETGIPWNDPSGDRLRQWLDMDRESFYDESRIAIVPMGFCYPGRDAKGGDRPPRPECAPHWHAQLRALLPNIRLTLLVGQYSQRYYLGARGARSVTDTVKAWTDFGPEYFPLPHPSFRNLMWLKKNPWFSDEVVPALRERVRDAWK